MQILLFSSFPVVLQMLLPCRLIIFLPSKPELRLRISMQRAQKDLVSNAVVITHITVFRLAKEDAVMGSRYGLQYFRQTYLPRRVPLQPNIPREQDQQIRLIHHILLQLGVDQIHAHILRCNFSTLRHVA
jgi:hypothetical protein